jgi:hypothetical protein
MVRLLQQKKFQKCGALWFDKIGRVRKTYCTQATKEILLFDYPLFPRNERECVMNDLTYLLFSLVSAKAREDACFPVW